MNKEIEGLVDNIEKVIVGNRFAINISIMTLLVGGHILFEDVPGVGKTQLATAIAKSVNGKFNRIQMTPDIMPSDVTGFSMIDSKTGELNFRFGAANCNFLLADEINRASPRSQSALLEIMEERQVSMDGVAHKLPSPFMVIATQNPIETYGTYHLPEAQTDRFTVRISLGYPSFLEEIKILDRNSAENPSDKIGAVISLERISELQKMVCDVTVSDKIKEYIVGIANATRNSENISLGVSPRGAITLFKSAKAYAFINGRDYVIPDDVKAIASSVLAHRISATQKGKNLFKTNDGIIADVIKNVVVPV